MRVMKYARGNRLICSIVAFGVALIVFEVLSLNGVRPIVLPRAITALGNGRKYLNVLSQYSGEIIGNNSAVRHDFQDEYSESDEDIAEKQYALPHIKLRRPRHILSRLNSRSKTMKDLHSVHSNSSSYGNSTVPKQLTLFKYVLTTTQRDLLLSYMDLIHQLSIRENFTYFLCDGSVIGSYRHHGMVPWDDDIDIMVPASQKVRFLTLFADAEMKGEPSVYKNNAFAFAKLYSPRSPHVHRGHVGRTTFTSPYIDVVFYDEDDHYIWHRKHPKMAKADIFPVQERPFYDKTYNAPRDPLKYIVQRGHTPSRCITSKLDHMLEKWRTPGQMASVLCRVLMNKFPFVRHTRGTDGDSCVEELVIGTRVLRTYVRTAKDISQC